MQWKCGLIFGCTVIKIAFKRKHNLQFQKGPYLDKNQSLTRRVCTNKNHNYNLFKEHRIYQIMYCLFLTLPLIRICLTPPKTLFNTV